MSDTILYNNFTSGLAYDSNNNVVYIMNTKAYVEKDSKTAFNLSKKINNLDNTAELSDGFEIKYINVYIENPDQDNRNILIEWIDEPTDGCYEVRVYKIINRGENNEK